MGVFDYPSGKHVRRHGPQGYANYDSYRPWLRDEFEFRCVWCLSREQWPRRSSFDIDHVLAQATNPVAQCDYDNLVYACSMCNGFKGAQALLGPCHIAFGEALLVKSDGAIEALNDHGRNLIAVLRLDNEHNTRYRRLIIEILSLAVEHNKDLYNQLTGIPDDLPDLSRLRPPGGNTRPEGLYQSFYAKQQRRSNGIKHRAR